MNEPEGRSRRAFRVALVYGPLASIVSEAGVGHQMPLSLLMVGGPLLDAGYEVKLFDPSARRLGPTQAAAEVVAWEPDLVLAGHAGSTTAHDTCVETLERVKAIRPESVTAYGGVHATYHAKQTLESHAGVDFVIRGEGEVSARALAEALAVTALDAAGLEEPPWKSVPGVSFRTAGELQSNPRPPPVEDLDVQRIAWELIDDWDLYQAFGMGRAAVVQFSRGCPHNCSYCGQWMFWQRWRHRDPVRFVDEVEWLVREKGVRFLWLADENPTTDQAIWRSLLKELAGRDLGLGLCGSFRAQDVVRDGSFLHLYKDAGFVYLLLGIESADDGLLEMVRKESTVDDAFKAIRLLRQAGILSIVDYMFGIEEESLSTLIRGLRGLNRYDGDFLNALYLTPHDWTPLGHELRNSSIVEPDLHYWDYRHQVLATRHLSPTSLFIGVKAVEALYHLHPRRLARLFTTKDRKLRRLIWHSMVHMTAVYFRELWERVSRAFRGELRMPSPSLGSLEAIDLARLNGMARIVTGRRRESASATGSESTSLTEVQ